MVALLLASLSAFALPGEAAAVLQQCGQPTAEHQGISPVTGQMQCDLTYNSAFLHLQPEEDGWSFTTAWSGHLPVSRHALETSIPCSVAPSGRPQQPPQPIADTTLSAGQR